MRQSSVVLLAVFAAISLAATGLQRRDEQATAWDPTTRDWMKKCSDLAQYSGTMFCEVFNTCCANDPLNGDKCQNRDSDCEWDEEAAKPKVSRCLLSNCTAMITTTPPPTTASYTKEAPNRLYSLIAWAASVFLLLI